MKGLLGRGMSNWRPRPLALGPRTIWPSWPQTLQTAVTVESGWWSGYAWRSHREAHSGLPATGSLLSFGNRKSVIRPLSNRKFWFPWSYGREISTAWVSWNVTPGSNPLRKSLPRCPPPRPFGFRVSKVDLIVFPQNVLLTLGPCFHVTHRSFPEPHASPHIHWMIFCCCCCLVAKSCSTLLQPHGLQPTRLLCPWDFPYLLKVKDGHNKRQKWYGPNRCIYIMQYSSSQ